MKKHPEAYWKLFRVIQNRTMPYITSGDHRGVFNSVLGLAETKGRSKGREATQNEEYWISWMQEFSEIDSSLTRLSQALVYMSHCPQTKAFRFHRLSEADWLRYHIEAYLQETYILHERLIHFLRMVEKSAIKGGDKDGLAAVKKSKTTVDMSFKNVVSVRGSHVHRCRFETDELRNLDTLVLLTTAGNLRKLRVFREAQYGTVLVKWRRQFSANNKEIEALCVSLIEKMTDVLESNEPPRNMTVQGHA